jgi:O-antigen/teichoic acid export membrane protein
MAALMAKRSSIAANTLFLLTARVAGCLLTVVLIAVVADTLDVAGFGRYTFALSTGAILAVFVDFGLAFLIPREVARDNTLFGKYLASGLMIRLLLFSAIFLVLAVSLPAFLEREAAYALLAAFATLTLRGFFEFFASFFNAFERMHYSAFLYLSGHLCVFGATFLAIYLGADQASGILLAQALALAGFTGAAFFLVVRILKPGRLTVDRALCLDLLKKTTPFALFAIGGVAYFMIDNLLLLSFRGEEEVGYYQSAMRLIMAAEMLPLVISSAIYPTISRIMKKSTEEAAAIAEQTLSLMLMLGVPIGVGTTMLAAPILKMIYPDKYAGVATALAIVAWLVPIRFCASVLGTVLSASGNQGLRTWATWSALAFNISVNVVLLPRFGYLGAAVTSVATSLFLGLFYYVALSLRFHRFRAFNALWKLVLPAAVLIVFLKFAEHWNILLAVMAGAALYLVLLIPAGVLTKEQIATLRRLAFDKERRINGIN